jgi:hypothetical protein
MDDSVLVIGRDHCYLTKLLPNLNEYQQNQNQDLFLVPESNNWNYWKNDGYVDLPNELIKCNIFDKVYMVHWLNHNNPMIPANTEILINFGFKINKNLPSNIKIYCNEYNDDVKDFNFPIELKYLCLPKNKCSDINKIKVPFGCKIILFGSEKKEKNIKENI